MKQKPAANNMPTRTLSGLDEIHWKMGTGDVRAARPSPALKHEHLELALMARTGHSYQHRRAQVGLYYWTRDDRHVWHESGFERTALEHLDFAGDVQHIAAQPMVILFGRDVSCQWHVPDYFGVCSNGDQVVYDVRPWERIDERAARQFAETRRICDLVGWRYEVLSDFHPTGEQNVRWLRGSRHPRNHPDTTSFHRLREIFGDGVPLSHGLRMFNLRYPEHASAHVFHLLWTRRLGTDMTVALNRTSTVWTTEKEEPCCPE